jgi:hypothetical protein
MVKEIIAIFNYTNPSFRLFIGTWPKTHVDF